MSSDNKIYIISEFTNLNNGKLVTKIPLRLKEELIGKNIYCLFM